MKYKVGKLIEDLSKLYHEDDVIFCTWWDRKLDYSGEHWVSSKNWNKALDLIDGNDFDVPFEIIFDTLRNYILEVEEMEEEDAGNNPNDL
jgi:hypothetical protein